MSLRWIAVSCALISTAGALLADAPEEGPGNKPNIVLIFADDMGINDLSCYGRKEHETPNIDRLATEGVRFTSAYCAQPICSPSRAALMTGLCPARLNLTNYLPGRPDAPSQRLLQPRIQGQLPLEETTIAEVLKRAGYVTGIFGKWHLGGKNFGPTEQGFDEAFLPRGTFPPDDPAGGKGEYAITDAAIRFIEAHRDQPFFCYVPHNNPHVPLSASTELTKRYADRFQPMYAAMIASLDDSVGKLLAKIAELGLNERTIVIFTSDNGGLHVHELPATPATHNTPFRAGKGFLYEGGLREPLIVRWPGHTKPGSLCDTPMVLTDLMPTLLEAAGLDVAKEVGPLDGVTILPLLHGETIPDRPLLWHFPNYTNQGGRPGGAIREGNWKLIEHYEDGAIELFDLSQDPGELNDLSMKEPERAAKLLDTLRKWRTSVGAQFPIPNPEFDAQRHKRLYVDLDPSKLLPGPTAAAMIPQWKSWRDAMDEAIRGRKPLVTPAEGDIRLHARDAEIHGSKLRYEPEPNKNVLGYWTEPSDWAEWSFTVERPASYEIELQLGCGPGNGGSEVAVHVDDVPFPFTVVETGHFQRMILQIVGVTELKTGAHKLSVRPIRKRGGAVMDLRRVVLRPDTDG